MSLEWRDVEQENSVQHDAIGLCRQILRTSSKSYILIIHSFNVFFPWSRGVGYSEEVMVCD